MTLLNELDDLVYEQKVAIYKDLQDTLLEVFAFDVYTDEEQLKKDFEELLHDPYYITVLEDFIKKYEVFNISLDKLYRGITPKRWKLCTQCKNPYLDYSTYNRTVLCYNQVYRRYAVTTQEYFKSSGSYSICYMNYKSEGSRRYSSREEDPES